MPPASRPLMLVGALQGVVLWFLWHAADTPHWPQGSPLVMGALLWAALAVPAAIYLSENAGLSPRRRLVLVLGVGALYLLLGAYAGWLGDPVDALERQPRLVGPYGSFAHVLAVLVLGFILIPLVAGRHGGRWHYPQLFRLAWRNALLGASVVAITLLFWGVLYAGAMLMKSLGIGFIFELIRKPLFAFPVTGIVIGAVFAQGHARADLLTNLRHYWLSLNAWLLPLLLFFGVMWMVALPFTGLDTLFGTRSAAFILLWFAALAVHFINCAWQDGAHELTYPRWLATCVRYAWITLPVVAAVAGWALWLRIHQYGLTEERIWAAFVWLLAMGYALGYGISLVPPLQRRLMPNSPAGVWMGSLGSTNILMAIITLLCLGLLASPVADPRRLAVADQVERLTSGRIAPADFDYAYLRWRADRWGTRALQELAAARGDARVADIAGRARQSLAQKQRWGGPDDDKAGALLSREEARRRIRSLQSPGMTAAVPDGLIDAMRERDGRRETHCLQPQYTCAVWMQDFNADGQLDALVLSNYATNHRSPPGATLYAERDGQWHAAATLQVDVTQAEWAEAIRSGKVQLREPAWKDVEVNGKRARPVPGPDGR